MNRQVLIGLLLTVVSFVWAGSFVVVKTVTSENIDPVNLGFLRFLVATPIMMGILLLRKKTLLIPKKELPSLIILGLTGVTLLYLFQFIGISYTTASISSVLINTNVIFIVILSVFFMHEKLTKRRISGIALSFIGVIIIMFSKISPNEFNLGNLFFMGCILMILSALCWAIYSLVGKRLLATYDEFVITTYAFALGSLFYLPIVATNIIPVLQHTSVNGWLAVLYLALICSIFGYIGWYYALKHMEASKAAVFLNFIPLFTIIMSLFLGETLSWPFFIGATLIISGVYLAQK